MVGVITQNLCNEVPAITQTILSESSRGGGGVQFGAQLSDTFLRVLLSFFFPPHRLLPETLPFLGASEHLCFLEETQLSGPEVRRGVWKGSPQLCRADLG